MLTVSGELIGYRVREFPGRNGKQGFTKRYLGLSSVRCDDYGRTIEDTTEIEVGQAGIEAAQSIAAKYNGKKLRIPVYVSVYVGQSGKAGHSICFSHLTADEIEVVE